MYNTANIRFITWFLGVFCESLKAKLETEMFMYARTMKRRCRYFVLRNSLSGEKNWADVILLSKTTRQFWQD